MRIVGLLLSICAGVLVAVPGRAQQAAPAGAPPAGLAEAFAAAQKGLAAADWAGVRDALTAAEAFAPAHPLVLYHLARAEALTGNPDGALLRLRRLVDAGGTERDLAADSAFALLRGRAEFRSVLQDLHEEATPVVRGDTAFALDDPDFIPEGIAYDAGRDVFFVGSLHRGQILRVRRDGSASVFAADAAGATRGRRGQVIGLRVDADRGILWAATLVVDTAAPPFRRGPGGWAALRAFDLSSGRLVGSYAPADSTSPHLFNDLALGPDGDVYVTDSEGDALFRLRNGATALERVYGGDPRFVYPNGVTVDAAGRIHVAHVEGITVFGLADGRVTGTPLATATGVPTSGIDGLYSCGGALIGIQSLLDSQRVTRFVLGADGVSVVGATALERKHPAHAVATTGVIVGDDLYYIAGSQLGRLLPDGSVRPAEGPPASSVVLRLPLDGACTAAPRPDALPGRQRR